MAVSDGMFITGTLSPLARRLQNVDKVLADVTKQAAFKLEALIVGHIQAQDLPWKELDAAYKALKEKQGHSELIWVRTGTALETVSVIDITPTDYFVGWVRGTPAGEGSDEEMHNIAAILEFGTTDGTIEARPVVQPSVDELAVWFEDQLHKALTGALTA